MDTNLAEKIECEELSVELYKEAMALKVVDEITMSTAGNILISLKDGEKASVVVIDEQIKDAHSRHRRLCDIKNRIVEPFQTASKYLRSQVSTYQTRLMLERQEAERKARIENEEKARKEQEKILAQAAKAEDQGKTGKAEELLEKAEQVYVEPVAIQAPEKTQQIANGAMTTKVDVEVTVVTVRDLCRAIADGKAPETLVKVEMGKVKTWVKLNNFRGSMFGLIIREVAGLSLRKGA